MGDRLDKITGELIAVVMQRAKAPSEAVAALMTAVFAILVETKGGTGNIYDLAPNRRQACQLKWGITGRRRDLSLSQSGNYLQRYDC